MPDSLKIPETLGACADLLHEIRDRRLALQREAEEWGKQENALTEHIIQTLPRSEGGAVGLHHQVHRVEKQVPVVRDWAALYKYITRHKAFELLQRRIAVAAVAERWDAKKTVPGVESFTTVSLSLTRV